MGKWRNRYKDFVGKKFGRLKVISLNKNNGFTGRWWNCLCDCGTLVVVPTGRLTTGNTKSCGCLKKEMLHPNLIGQKFGKLTVIEALGVRQLYSIWKCKCECGGEKIVRTSSLKSGAVRSCGCLRSGYLKNAKGHLEYGEAVRNLVIKMYRDNAKKQGHTWKLSKKEAIDLLAGNCYYCGCPPSRTRVDPGKYGEFTYNGIDRIDNSKGYISSNVVSCCTTCNLKKEKMTVKEFINWIRKVYNHTKFSLYG